MDTDLKKINAVFGKKLSAGEYTVHGLLRDTANPRLLPVALLCLKGSKGWKAIESPYLIHSDSLKEHPDHALVSSKFGFETSKHVTDFKGLGSMAHHFCWLLSRQGKPPVTALIPGPSAAEIMTNKKRQKMSEGKGLSLHTKWRNDAVGIWWLVDIHCFTSDSIPIIGMGPNTIEVSNSGNFPARLFDVDASPFDSEGNLLVKIPSGKDELWGGSDRHYTFLPTLEVLEAAASRKFKQQNFDHGDNISAWQPPRRW